MKPTQSGDSRVKTLKLLFLLGTAGAVSISVLVFLLPVRGLAKAPEGRYTVSEETALDNVTQLTWQRSISNETLSRQGAKDYCQSLAIGGNEWRLPTISELESLVDWSQKNWAIDSTVFPRPQVPLEDRFWSSTVDANNSSNSWYIDFYWGNSSTWSQSSLGYVRCVR